MLGFGLALDHWVYGVWAFMGAFTSLYVAPEPYRKRGATLLAVLIGLTLSLAIASLTSSNWWLTGIALGVISAGATFFTGVWRIPLPQSLMFILIACIASALPVDPRQTPLRVAFVLVGGSAAWIQGMAGWALHPRKPETVAVHKAYREIAQYFAVLRTEHSVKGQYQAALALKHAEDSVTAIRGTRTPKDEGYRLIQLTEEAEDLFRAVVALSATLDAPAPEIWQKTVSALAEGIIHHQAAPPLVPAAPTSSQEWHRLRYQVERVQKVLAGKPLHLRQVRSERLPSARRRIGEALRKEASVRSAALRMGVAVTAGTLLSHTLGETHPYWVPLTIGAILQGSTSMTMAWRAIQRVIGTIGGLALTLGLLLLHPSLPVYLAMIVLLQFSMLLLIVRNYAVSVALITAMALVIISSEIHAPILPMISARLIDTLVGAVLAVFALRWLWARTASEQLGPILADTILRSGRLLDYFLAKSPSDEIARARAQVATSILHLRANYDRALNEIQPPAEVVELWPAVVAVQRLAYLTPAVAEDLGPRQTPTMDHESRKRLRRLFERLAEAAENGPASIHWEEVMPPKLPHLHSVRRQLDALIDALQHEHHARERVSH